jgi:NADH-quinone oxidoreductase subunit J
VNWHTFFFLLFSLLACGFALAVVFSGNIVRMAFYLVLSLGSTAGLFFLAGSDFIGAMQLLIYVGGTLVLLVFGVMLTAQSPFINMKTPSGDWVLTAFVAGPLLGLLIWNATSLPEWHAGPSKESAVAAEPTATVVGQGLLGLRVDDLKSQSGGSGSGLAGYMLPFEIVSVHLLVVLIGAAYLARAKRRSRPREFEVAT